MRAQLVADFERFKDALPREFPAYVREAYHIDLTGRYLGQSLAHPIGKGSGQLSLNERQLEEDRAAGLAFVVLKTLIAEDDSGVQSMAAWAIHETKMKVERRRVAGVDRGWTVTWKGRGWDRSFDAYLELVRTGRDLTRSGELLVIPSVKYHLPRLGVPFVESEYRTRRRVWRTRGTSPRCSSRRIFLPPWPAIPWRRIAPRSFAGCGRFPISFAAPRRSRLVSR